MILYFLKILIKTYIFKFLLFHPFFRKYFRVTLAIKHPQNMIKIIVENI